MITFEKAYEIAKELKPNIDGCIEYDKGYMFTAEADKYTFGGDGACCVLKSDGKAVSQTVFFDSYKPVEVGKRELPKG